jgi:hypothetical protein
MQHFPLVNNLLTQGNLGTGNIYNVPREYHIARKQKCA